ncbi:hypothetical protein [Sphingobium abikonense]|uniref:hypothetical protein n=1 Tax=Sphingobium abikonense TaxID=86193 RepID=UPI003513C1DF
MNNSVVEESRISIDIESIRLDQEMEATWGCPVPAEGDYEEWFGWYHIDDKPHYWTFDPKARTWRVRSDTGRPILVDASLTDRERRRLEESMAILQYCSPPLPRDTSVRSETAPFLYDGWLYAWYYFPELKRWTLAPVIRH